MSVKAMRHALLISGLSLVHRVGAGRPRACRWRSPNTTRRRCWPRWSRPATCRRSTERLPAEPLVQEVVEEIGTYGGTLRRGFLGPSDHNNYTRVVYDALVRHSPDGSEVIPHIAKGWESNDDFTQWKVFLREGMKWSDGAPFTADDIMFWYEHIVLNEDLSPTVPVWMQNADGSAATVEKLDDTTVQWTFAEPNTAFLLEPRQHGRRRPVDHQPRLRAGALHEAVPSGFRRPGRAATPRWPSAAFRPGPSCSRSRRCRTPAATAPAPRPGSRTAPPSPTRCS